jgi:hypothetical protein
MIPAMSRKTKYTFVLGVTSLLLTFAFQNCADTGFYTAGTKSFDMSSLSAADPTNVAGFSYSFNSSTGQKIGSESLLGESFTLFLDFTLSTNGSLLRFHNGDPGEQGVFIKNENGKITVSITNELSNSTEFEYPTPLQLRKSAVTIVSTKNLETAKAYINGNKMIKVKSGIGALPYIPRTVHPSLGMNSNVFLFSGERNIFELNSINKYLSSLGGYTISYIDGSGSNGGGSGGGPKPIAYNAEMQSLLSNRCMACHTSDNLNARLAQGGQNFIKASFRGEAGVRQMPPTGRLSDNELSIVDRWVESLK